MPTTQPLYAEEKRDLRERYPAKVRQEIHKHLDQSYTPSQIAAAMGLSSKYVRQVKAAYNARQWRPSTKSNYPVISSEVIFLVKAIDGEKE